MKKSRDEFFNYEKHFAKDCINDELFDPDDNLFNNPYDGEGLTFRSRVDKKSKGQTFSKNHEKKSKNEK